jgi:hypothetical protein
MDDPPRMSEQEAAEFQRRRRGRNMALLLVLIGLAVLFFAITIVKMTRL